MTLPAPRPVRRYYRAPTITGLPSGAPSNEPIAQIIIRPNETYAGKFPNEDAQSFVFETSNPVSYTHLTLPTTPYV